MWARPFLDDQREDRRAFDRAIEGGANPEDIVDAARAWVAAADAPRYLKPLAVWLDRRGWEVVPPKRGKTRAPRSNGRKPNLSNMFFAEGGYEEDDLGNMVWGGVS